ncbi:hypothetical protein KDX27_42135 [Burkholderia cenocepacia]|uniref:hypothetical protein n=1 Tax=Burkholderia cenocepacia TaxID=95486 RepID=UPI001B9EBBEB|nr:hypothetical protein [Burkholderia cenocepacia]MBR8025196.1 hypothetical protein [Burkholderia cenocepacia]MBR8174265.1 hypothetical protein [Burkholderia cenocepacia]
MNPITYLCGALDRLFERRPVTAMLLALAIAFACAIGIASIPDSTLAVRAAWGT